MKVWKILYSDFGSVVQGSMLHQFKEVQHLVLNGFKHKIIDLKKFMYVLTHLLFCILMHFLSVEIHVYCKVSHTTLNEVQFGTE